MHIFFKLLRSTSANKTQMFVSFIFDAFTVEKNVDNFDIMI